MTYAFTFDARFCSGCKACQAACKDKNNLPTGVLWRRVYEVSGGTWHEEGEAWNNTVFAYNFSVSCNHCSYPKCAGVCPTKAYVTHESGIVLLDSTKCMGCGYCAWACPYGAPQYNPDAGCMTKCDFCLDQLEQELPPACIAACPMRVLDYGDTAIKKGIPLWNTPPEKHPFPLPAFSHTQPRLAVQPHPAMSIPEKKYVANLEEVRPRLPSSWEDLPLIVFTLLAQMAVGSYWAMSWMFSPFTKLVPALWVGICLGAGLLASFAHLGKKVNARYALRNLRKSSLSREILFAVLFGLGCLSTVVESLIWHRSTFEWTAITSIFGIGLIYSMSQVYRFPAAPGWSSWRTNAGFMISALLLGHSVMALILAYEVSGTGIQISSNQWVLVGGGVFLSLLAQLALTRRGSSSAAIQNIRLGLIFVGMALAATMFFPLDLDQVWISSLILMTVLIEEGLGRWLFYHGERNLSA